MSARSFEVYVSMVTKNHHDVTPAFLASYIAARDPQSMRYDTWREAISTLLRDMDYRDYAQADHGFVEEFWGYHSELAFFLPEDCGIPREALKYDILGPLQANLRDLLDIRVKVDGVV